MSLTVSLEAPPEQPTSRRNFGAGELIRVYGISRGLTGLPDNISPVRVTLEGDNWYPQWQEEKPAWNGAFWYDFELPVTPGKGRIKVESAGVIGEDETIIPISVGNVRPDDMPDIKGNNPIKIVGDTVAEGVQNIVGGAAEGLKPAQTTIMLLAVGAVALLVLYMVFVSRTVRNA